MKHTITAEFEIVTPMFLGGAVEDKTGAIELADAIRPPSIKGALRFWWRALQWSQTREQYSCEEAALMHLHAQEAYLFGSATKDKQGGQGVFSLKVKFKNAEQPINNYPANDGARYVGLGLFEMGEHKQRQAFAENQTFTLEVLFHPRAEDADIVSIKQAVEAFGLLGGLGARGQRRGFGSVSLKVLGGVSKLPSDLREYKEKLKNLLAATGNLPEEAPFSVLHRQSQIVLLAKGKTARNVHDKVGSVFKAFRGQDGPYRGKEKIPLGLPLQGVSQKRRASPLSFHIHKLSNGFVGIAILFEAEFHPDYPDVELTIIQTWLAGKEAINR
jgi:CRISPR-associated protein Cmr1